MQHLAEARQRSANRLMREAVAQGVEHEERRDTFRQDTLKAWDDHQATGLHATAGEVEKWLSSWVKDDEVSAARFMNCPSNTGGLIDFGEGGF